MEYGEYQQAELHEVTRLFISTETTVAHAANATVLNVYDSGDFRDDGGFLKVFIDAPDPEADPETPEGQEVSYVLEYETKNDDLNTITLIDPLPLAIDEDTRVWPDPLASEKWGSVVIDGDSEPVPALVHSNLELGVEEGIRDEPEGVIVQLQGNDYVIVSFPGKGTTIDWGNIDPDKIPDPTEGPGPGEAPVLTATPGLRSVHLEWTQIPPNPRTLQSIYYEIHASTVENFTPGEGTFLAAQLGHVLLVQEMPDGTELSTTEPTYFQVRSFDKNGTGPWSNEVSAIAIAGLDPAIVYQLQEDLEIAQGELDTLNNTTLPELNNELAQLDGKFPISSVDIGTDAITAPKILAGAVLTEKMVANSILGDRIAANTLQAAKIVAGSMTTDRFTSNSISGDIITANTLNAVKIVAGSIVSDRIDTGAITSTKLATGAVTAEKIDTGAITADKIDVNALNGKVITGSLVQTDIVGRRVVMDNLNDRLRFYSSEGSLRGYLRGVTQAESIFNDPGVEMRYNSGGGSVAVTTLGVFTDGPLFVKDFIIEGTGRQFVSNSSLQVYNRITANTLFVDIPRSDLVGVPNMRWSLEGGGGQVCYTSHSNSSLRYKDVIGPLLGRLTKQQILQPEPQIYTLKSEVSDRPKGFKHWGLIAEELDRAGLNRFLEYDDQGPNEIDFAKFAAIGHQLVLREHDAELIELRERVRVLEERFTS